MIEILAYIFAAMVISIPIGVIVIFCLALKVAYDIRKRSLLERYLCVVYDIRKSKRGGAANNYFNKRITKDLLKPHFLHILKFQGKKV